MRITVRDLKIKIERLNNFFELSDTTSHKLVLDQAYGGYKVALREQPTGGERDLSDRLNARECYHALVGMEKALELIGSIYGASYIPSVSDLNYLTSKGKVIR